MDAEITISEAIRNEFLEEQTDMNNDIAVACAVDELDKLCARNEMYEVGKLFIERTKGATDEYLRKVDALTMNAKPFEGKYYPTESQKLAYMMLLSYAQSENSPYWRSVYIHSALDNTVDTNIHGLILALPEGGHYHVLEKIRAQRILLNQKQIEHKPDHKPNSDTSNSD